jgi:hypothetical protein
MQLMAMIKDRDARIAELAAQVEALVVRIDKLSERLARAEVALSRERK